MRRVVPAVLLSLIASACVAPAIGGDPSTTLETSKDDLVLGGSFDRNDVVSDAFFRDAALIDAEDIQAFLESTPWGGRSFLADQTVGGQRFSSLLDAASRAEGINPLMLLARMQVEKSLVRKTSVPARTHDVDFAFGCGCPDGRACNEAYRGLDRQVVCAAQTHASRFADSQAGTAQWRRDLRRNSLDGFAVTPANHATAALYAYTPHVGLRGQRITGGNALVHNVLQRFVRHLIALGRLVEADLPDARNPWVGTACTESAQCDLGRSGERCETFAGGGFCTVGCEGTCPDRAGHAPTFCVSLDGGATGACVSQAEASNSDCAALPGTVAETRPRHVGASGAVARSATVCVPAMSMPEPPVEPGDRCDDSCALANNGTCEDESMGGAFSDCGPGSDCSDCGVPVPSPTMAACSETCAYSNDGECDDGGPGSDYALCELGSDCMDCGAR
ncbi:MAG: hypothetical protein AB8I08_07340 [Sandaracinaceae bacterium]